MTRGERMRSSLVFIADTLAKRTRLANSVRWRHRERKYIHKVKNEFFGLYRRIVSKTIVFGKQCEMKTQRTNMHSHNEWEVDGNRRSIRGQDDSPRIHDDGKTIIKVVFGRCPSGNQQHGNNATSFHQVANWARQKEKERDWCARF